MRPFTIYVDVAGGYSSRVYMNFLKFIPEKTGMVLKWIEEAGLEVPKGSYKVRYTPDENGPLVYEDKKIYSSSIPAFSRRLATSEWFICIGPKFDKSIRVRRDIIWRKSL